MTGQYTTAQGQVIDMERLRLENEHVKAVGNMAVNSRGDVIAPNGDIIKPRNQVMREHYAEFNTETEKK